MLNLNTLSTIERLQEQNRAFHAAKAEKKKVDEIKKQIEEQSKKKKSRWFVAQECIMKFLQPLLVSNAWFAVRSRQY